MVGSGGIWVEALDDIAFALAPLALAEARDLISTLRVSAALHRWPRQAAADLDALARPSSRGRPPRQPAAGRSLDLNPVLASAAGAVAVDWKITV